MLFQWKTGSLPVVRLAILQAHPFRVESDGRKPAYTGEALPKTRESVQTSSSSVPVIGDTVQKYCNLYVAPMQACPFILNKAAMTSDACIVAKILYNKHNSI